MPKHGELIAARHPLRPDRTWARAARYPELFARARVEWPEVDGGIDVITAHIPNGSYNGWVKVEHLRLLGVALQSAPDAPRILTGDFNEPREFRSSGQIVSWGAKPKEHGALSVGGVVSKGTPEPRPRVDWGRAVRDVLSTSSHGLMNVIEARHGMVPTPITHLVGDQHPRCFDHGFASRHFEVVDSGYHHGWREREWSDHSALFFTLRPREVGALTEWATWPRSPYASGEIQPREIPGDRQLPGPDSAADAGRLADALDRRPGRGPDAVGALLQ